MSIPSENGAIRHGIVMNASRSHVRIHDLATGQALGVPLSVPNRPRDTQTPELVRVFEDQGHMIAVLSRKTRPDTFFNGNTLTYYKMATGEVLRIREEIENEMGLAPFGTRSGKVLVVEKERHSYGLNQVGIRIVDVLNNLVIEDETDLEGLLEPFKSASGENVLLTVVRNHNVPNGAVCVLSLESFDRECISNPSINSQILFRRWGYLQIENGLISLPLIEPSSNSSGRFEGIARFTVQ